MIFNYELLFDEVKQRGITFTHVANKIGMTRQNLSLVKQKGKELSATQVVIICDMLSLPVEKFVTK